MAESKNPVEYAEKVLDVHGPWVEAQKRLEQYSLASDKVTQSRNTIRVIKSQHDDRKFTLTTEAPARPGYPSGVMAQRDFVKLIVETDSECTDLNARLAECQSELESFEAEVRHHELGLKVLQARLTELGGLLHFYAAAKEAQTAAQSRVQHV